MIKHIATKRKVLCRGLNFENAMVRNEDHVGLCLRENGKWWARRKDDSAAVVIDRAAKALVVFHSRRGADSVTFDEDVTDFRTGNDRTDRTWRGRSH